MSHTIKIQKVLVDDLETFKAYDSVSSVEIEEDKNEENDDECETCNEDEINDFKMANSC